jgi:hydroxyacyl-ACP dehydratase HTD2-like protein with hotdog domain
MTRTELVKRLADHATKPLAQQDAANEFDAGMHQPVETEQTPAAPAPVRPSGDLFVWFEDTAARREQGRRGIAGLPESLLPWDYKMRVVERRYAEGHLHLLSAVRLRCGERQGERIAAIYTAALSVGTVAWIGTGRQYEQAWHEMFPYGADQAGPGSSTGEACGAYHEGPARSEESARRTVIPPRFER